MPKNITERLKEITVSAYGKKIPGDILLSRLTDDELQEVLDDLLENALATREFENLGKNL